LDNVALADGNRVLVKDQTAPAENGIYVVDNAAAGNWSRAADFDQAGEVTVDYRARMAGGDTQAGFVYRQTATVTTINSDPIVWEFYAALAAPTANDFEINAGTLRVKPAFSLDIPPNASITLKVSGTVGSSYAPGQAIQNTASIAWTSVQDPGSDERTGAGGINDYPASDAANTQSATMTAAKSLFGTDQTETSGSSVTLGEKVTYALKVTFPEGTTADLTVVDLLPSGLLYDSYQVVTTRAASQDATGAYLLDADFTGSVPTPSVAGGAANGDDVTFTFGSIAVTGNNVATDNAFLILVTARVLDVVGNAGFSPPGQTMLANSATFDINGDGQTALSSGPIDITVGEPRMVIGKNIVQANADFGYFGLPAAIGDFVWDDLNDNGLQEATEPGIAHASSLSQSLIPDPMARWAPGTTWSRP
jgi:fimbrial isopeptide formation D2 family protein